jgi:hypothetical protein
MKMNGLLLRLGVDPRAFYALLRAAIQMDLRSQHYRRATLAGDSKVFTPLFWVVAQNLFISLVVSVVLFGRADVLTFAAITLGLSMFLLACAIVVEFNEVVLSPEDRDILAPLPVSPRTYAAVRLANLLFYTGLLGSALNLIPALLGVWLPDAGWLYLPAYLVAAVAADVLATGGVILCYLALIHFVGNRRVKDVLAYAQLGLTLATMYGIQLVSRDSEGQVLEHLRHPPAWLAWTPPGWFAGLVSGASGKPSPDLAWQALLAGITLAGVSWLTLRQLTIQYARLQSDEKQGAEPASSGGRGRFGQLLSGWILKAITRSREEATACWLCWTLFRRDHDLKMRSYPSLGAAPGFLLLGWITGQLADPLDPSTSDSNAAMAIIILYLLALALPIVAHNMTFSREYQAAWIFYTAPLSSPAAFASGLRQVVVYGMAVPVLLLLFLGFTVVWGHPLHAALHCLAGFLLCRISGHLTLYGVIRAWPFSRQYVRGEVSGSITMLLAAMMGGATVVGLVQRSAYHSTLGLCLFLGVLLVTDGILGWWLRD